MRMKRIIQIAFAALCLLAFGAYVTYVAFSLISYR